MSESAPSSQPRSFYRAMDDNEDGGPRCGSDEAQLGARVPADILPDDDGNVHPETGGMSAAADDPRFLPPHFRPALKPLRESLKSGSGPLRRTRQKQ